MTALMHVLVEADVRDVDWLRRHVALTGTVVSDWRLAGYREFGHPPPPRSACAPSLQQRLDARIAEWTEASRL